jgi:hypothetical protein
MPLVTFKRSANNSYFSTKGLTEPLDDFRQTVNLPRESYNHQWILRSVNVLYRKRTERLRYVEIHFPQLMPEDKMMYSTGSEGVTPLPRNVLRFYPNKRGMEQRLFYNHIMSGIAVSPDLNLGVHRLDQLQLDMFITARDTDGNLAGVTTYEVILEYI